MSNKWAIGDFVYVPGYTERLTIFLISDGLCVCSNGSIVVMTGAENLAPKPYMVRGGIVYDGDIPVGVF